MADDPNAAPRRGRKHASGPVEDAQLAVPGSGDEPADDEPAEEAAPGAAATESTDGGEPSEPTAPVPDAAPELAADPGPISEPPADDAVVELEPAQAGSDEPLDDWTAEEVAAESDAPTTLWSSPVPEPSTWLPWLQARSPDERICPFLRAVADDDGLGFPVESPDPANRCAAMRDAVPQSLRQQELVCLTATHVNCPRYLRGATVASAVAAPKVRSKALMTPAISVSLVILALSFGASVVFGLTNGAALTMPSPVASGPAAVPSASVVAAASPTPTSEPTPPTAEPSMASEAAASPSVAPSPSGSASPSPAPSPSPTSSPTSEAAPTPVPTSGRYKLLKPCPGKANCWIYTIRSGDNLFSIAKYFGVPLKKVKALNAWTETKRLKAGQKLILPTPTR